jgi:hypothetical protein
MVEGRDSDYFIDMTAFAALSYIVSMPRIARAVAVGYPHHITQRGIFMQGYDI